MVRGVTWGGSAGKPFVIGGMGFLDVDCGDALLSDSDSHRRIGSVDSEESNQCVLPHLVADLFRMYRGEGRLRTIGLKYYPRASNAR